jgi:putative NAD(P)H nitroreductase
MFNIVKKRRSIHNFIPNKMIPKEDIQKLIEGVSYTPSGYNAQPWSFVVIEKKERLKDIQGIAFDQKHVSQASAIIMVLGDVNIGRNAENLLKDWVKFGYCTQKEVPVYMNAFCKKRPENKKREMCIRNVAMAAMNLLLIAEDMGLATCPMMGFNQPLLIDYLKLPEDIIPVLMVAIGYEDKGKEKPQLPRKKLEDILYFEEYGNNSF